MKSFLITLTLSLIGSCATTKHSTKLNSINKNIVIHDSVIIKKYANTITKESLKKIVDTLASETFQGRKIGTEGLKKATSYIKNYYKREGILPAVDTSYSQYIPDTISVKLKNRKTENILALIKGAEKPEEVVIISAHIDHLGVKHNKIHYGADDNASGTAAIMEIAKAFKIAEKNGHSPKRSILIAHFTAEEVGLFGSKYYSENPIFPLKNTIANLNIDMIGRVDDKHKDNPNYIYIIGADRISNQLKFITEKVNTTHTNLELDYTYNDENDPNRYYYRSDHYNFARKGIPCVFFFNGTHNDYHKHTDTKDKINSELLKKRTELIFSLTWYLANMESKLILNSEL